MAIAERPDAGYQSAEAEVWQLLDRADVILRGVLAIQDSAERRRWEERMRIWLHNLNRAWVQSHHSPR